MGIMRNTEQYPITLDEMITACEIARAEILAKWDNDPEKIPIGDITPIALQEAAKFIREYKQLSEKVL